MKNKRALVTGGAGFIGSNIVKVLLNNNWNVKVIDDLSSGNSINLEGLNVEFIKGSINNDVLINQACIDIDVVFHLAACVGRQKSIDNPILDSSTNVLGTLSVLEAMKNNNVKKIIYSSSAAIFGELETSSISEDHPLNADSPYGVSKLAAEKMILAYSGIYNITGICLRYFNIYGVHQRFDVYGNVIPIFANRLYEGKPLTIYGNGEQTRDFVNVKDVARANHLAALSSLETDVYNLGSGTSITINKLAQKMQEISGVKSEIKYVSERAADVKHCKARTNKVMEDLNFISEINIEEGLKEYLEWFIENL